MTKIKVASSRDQTDSGGEEWATRSIAECGQVIAGKALNATGPGARRAYLRTVNVLDGEIRLDDILEMPMTDAEFQRYVLREGDVLLNEGQSLELVGRCAIVPAELDGRFAIQNQLVRFRAFDGTSPSFASHLFRHFQATGVFQKISLQTTSVAHLGVSRFARLEVAWPSQAEQRAIAGVLSDVDDLLQSLDRLIAKKRDVKQGAMQQLLTGAIRLPRFEGEWETKRLGEVAQVVMGQSPSSVNYNRRGDGLPLIQGNADIKCRRAIKRCFTTQITKRGVAGDVLMSVRAPVGEIAVTDFDVCLGRGVCAIRYPNKYLYHLLVYLEPAWARQSKGSTFDSVNSSDVRTTEVWMPVSGQEQSAIAAVLSDMDAEIEALEDRRAKTAAIKQGMMQELLTGRTRLPIPQEA